MTVESYSRLARDTRNLLNIVDTRNKKGVAFVSQEEQIDTSTPTGRFILSVFVSLAQFEREQILARQAEGIAILKRNSIFAFACAEMVFHRIYGLNLTIQQAIPILEFPRKSS